MTSPNVNTKGQTPRRIARKCDIARFKRLQNKRLIRRLKDDIEDLQEEIEALRPLARGQKI